MNYLAHAYLSFGNEEILVGNMISDFVKGKKQFDYPSGIQKGIKLHRLIDGFTDDHPLTKEANNCFKPVVRLYAGAFTDIVYDHFLALDKNSWKERTLADFSAGVYSVLTRHQQLLPERFVKMLPYMIQHDWLFNYQFKRGIEQSFAGLARRAAYLDNASPAFEAFEKNYDVLGRLSQAFITDVKKFAATTFHQLMKV